MSTEPSKQVNLSDFKETSAIKVDIWNWLSANPHRTSIEVGKALGLDKVTTSGCLSTLKAGGFLTAIRTSDKNGTMRLHFTAKGETYEPPKLTRLRRRKLPLHEFTLDHTPIALIADTVKRNNVTVNHAAEKPEPKPPYQDLATITYDRNRTIEAQAASIVDQLPLRLGLAIAFVLANLRTGKA
jgi:hypothetical protein